MIGHRKNVEWGKGLLHRIRACVPALGLMMAGCAAQAPQSAAQGKAADTPAIILLSSCSKPEYPYKGADPHDLKASIVIEFDLTKEGDIVGSRIQKGSGFPELDQVTHAALKMCKFTPERKNNVAVAGKATVHYNWDIER